MGETVVFLGDSITASGEWQTWLPEFTVVNAGVNGDTTDDLLARLDDVITAAPFAIVLLIGTNDFSQRKSVEHVVRNSETIVATLRTSLPDARILAQSITPRGHEFSAQISDANRHLWQFAPTQRAGWVDLWPTLGLDDGELNPTYTDDRLHLNAAGYEAWLSVLRPILLNDPRAE